MEHPLMVDPDDAYCSRLRQLALALPGAAEKLTHGHPAFYTTKVFAYYGAGRKLAPGKHEQHPTALVIQPTDEDREPLLAQARVFEPAYWGPYGWLAIDLGDETDWDEVAELLDASYRLTAGKRLIAQLDGGRTSA